MTVLAVFIISHPCAKTPGSSWIWKGLKLDHRFICVVDADKKDWKLGMMLTNTTSGSSTGYTMAIRTWAQHTAIDNNNWNAEKATVFKFVGFISNGVCANPTEGCEWLWERLNLPDSYYASLRNAWVPGQPREDCHCVGEQVEKLFNTPGFTSDYTNTVTNVRGKIITKETAKKNSNICKKVRKRAVA